AAHFSLNDSILRRRGVSRRGPRRSNLSVAEGRPGPGRPWWRQGLDVIITTVPEGAQVLEFLDTAWVTPGAFVGAVDLARSWKRGTLRAMDILATDEREQTRVLTASGRMTFAGPTKRISPIWRAAPSRGAVRRRNARCSISPVTRWPIWLWHRSSTRQRCGKAWVRGWRAELTVCFGSVRDRWPQTLAPFHEKGASHGSVQCCDEARFLGLFAARKLAQQLRGR